MKNEKGFTLVEMMIVCVLICTLSVFAIRGYKSVAAKIKKQHVDYIERIEKISNCATRACK